jgi:type IV secretion system protein TrbL
MITDNFLLDNTLAGIITAVQTEYPLLVITMGAILAGLATLHLAMPAIRSIGNGNLTGFLPDFAITLLRVGLLLVFMTNVAQWGNDIVDGMKQVAGNVTGMSPATLTPSGVFNAGLVIVSTLEQAAGKFHWWHPILAIEYAILIAIVFLAFFAAAVIYLLTLIAATWVIYTGPIWIALAGLEQTYDTFITWGIRLIGIGVYVLLQIMVIAVGMTLIQGWSANLTANQNAIITNIYWLLISVAQGALFCWMVAYIPNFLMSLAGHSLVGGEFGHELASSTPMTVAREAAGAFKTAGKAASKAISHLEQSSHHKKVITFPKN